MKPKTKRSKKFSVGVVGIGFMGENHVRIISKMPGVALAGVYDADPLRTEVVAIKYNTKGFPDFASMLTEVDAVVISSPTSTHFELSLLAIESGKHVFVEKPLAATAEEGLRLVNAAADKKVVLSCGMIERFNPAFTVAENLIRKDRPLIINLKREAPLPERITDASVILDMMIHDLDLAVKIAGTTPAEFKAKGRKVKTKNIDVATASVLFKNGIVANIEASRVAEAKVRTLSCDCEHSTVKADLLNKTVSQKFPSDPSQPTLEPPKETIYQVAPADQITLELKDFFACAKKGREPEVGGKDALVSLRLAEDIERKVLKK
jgi:predicted dehydrogenase